MLKVVFYETSKMNSEVRGFLRELNINAKAGNKVSAELLDSIQYTVARIRDEGPMAGMPFTRKLRGGVWELRPTNYRITYFLFHDSIILLTVFRKQSQQTPSYEIDRAEKRMRDWITRYDKR